MQTAIFMRPESYANVLPFGTRRCPNGPDRRVGRRSNRCTSGSRPSDIAGRTIPRQGDHTVERAVLVGTTGGLGLIVLHLPDRPAVGVVDQTVVDQLVVIALADREDVDT